MHAGCVAASHSAFTPPGPLSSRVACGRLLTRQEASAFNQELSFDMSKVTNKENMFLVRSARALTPAALSQAIHAACTTITLRLLTPRRICVPSF